MRKKIIAANWKMHKTVHETEKFLRELMSSDMPHEAWIAPPFTSLHAAAQIVSNAKVKIHLGGQNMHAAAQGAFTGEISGSMLKEAGASFCIIGHSERRNLFHENDAEINAKLKSAFHVGLTPIFCVGESAAARDSGDFMDPIELQLSSGLLGIESPHFKNLVLAYEPIWAIGTGKAATPQLAQETHNKIRGYIAAKWGGDIAKSLPILYGGSVNVANAKQLLSEPDIDGLLIGGAALEVQSYLSILRQQQ
jgi:triosephosphate isomerase